MKKIIFKVVTWNDVQHTYKTLEEFNQYEQAESFITKYEGDFTLQIQKEWRPTHKIYTPNLREAGAGTEL